MKQTLYKLGRYLMHLNYVKGADCVEHDLRLEVSELKKEVSRLSIANTILRLNRKGLKWPAKERRASAPLKNDNYITH